MAKPIPPTLTDFAVTAVSPALIMTMIGSLVFFLIEVLYAGQYSGRLLYTMVFFIFGAVLIARIAINDGKRKAQAYGACLAAAVFLAMQAFVTYPEGPAQKLAPLLNLMLMAVIWWAANKLTWDCTHIDEDRKHAGRGVLDAAGIPEEEEDALEGKPLRKNATWLERWEHHRAKQQKKAHTPGVWVFYFSLAALPVFGLGQSLIPSDAESRRSYVFRLMAVYIGSGLGLLAATTLLGLRKYLRDRGAAIPVKMTGGWLGLAAVIVMVFLVVAAALPRPYSETPIVKLPKLSSKERDADKNAPMKDGGKGKGEGDQGREQTQNKDGQQTRDGNQGARKKDEGEKSGDQKGEDQGESEKKEGGDKSESEAEGQKPSERNREGNSKPPSKMLDSIGTFLKWLAWIIVALMVLAAILVFILYYLAPFTDWARNLLDRLRNMFKRDVKKENVKAAVEEQALVRKPPPFRSFSDPLTNGERMSLPEMVSYSFEALESWAWERGLAKEPKETPLEFAKRIEAETGLEGLPLAKLVGQMQYSTEPLRKNDVNVIREFWTAEPLQSVPRD